MIRSHHKSGMIFLMYQKTGEVVTGKKYDGRTSRKEIIAQWKVLYAAAFGSCYIQIAPQVNYNMVNPDGTNKYLYQIQNKNKK